MNETPPATPEPDPASTPDSNDSTASDDNASEPAESETAFEPAESVEQEEDIPPVPPSDTRPGGPQRVLITLLFLVLGLGAALAAWQLQSEFIIKAGPLAPSGIPGEAQEDPEISLYGLEYAFAALGVPSRHSSFNILEGPGSDSQSPPPSSPDPAQVLAQMQLEAERAIKETAPRRNRVAVYLLLLGVMLGAATGLSEGIRRRSVLLILGGTLACAVLAGSAGFLGGALHSRVANALDGQDLNPYVALMAPQLVAWLALALGLIAWPLAMNPSLKATEGLGTAAIAGALLCSLIYVPLAQTIFFDDPLEHSLPAHVYSYMFWFLFGSGVLSLLIGNACANIGRQPRTATE